MPVKFDIFNKEVLANQSDYATVTLLASGDVVDVPVIPTVANYLSTNNVTISSLVVSSNISANNIIYALGGNSNLWNDAYTTVQQGSSNWYSASAAATTYTQQNFLPLSGGTIKGSLYILSSLYVLGSAFTVNTTDLTVKDPIIYIADNNQTDILDVGIMASWTNGSYPAGYQHGGLVRRQDNKIWTLFSGATAEPLSGVNVNWNQTGILLEPLSAKFYGDIYGNRNVFGSLSASGNLSAASITIGPTLNCSSNQLNLNLAGNATAITFDGTGTPSPGLVIPTVIANGDFTLASGRTGSGNIILRVPSGNSIEQRNGLSPQTYRLYNSYTNATNYQRSTLTHANSALVLGTEYTTTAGNSALSGQAMPIILAPGYNQSLSATAPVVLQQTWNNSNNTFTLLSANVTDTASNSNSNLLDFQVGGLSKFRITKTGVLQLSSNTSTVIDFTNPDNSFNFFRVNSAGGVTIGNNGGLSVGQSGITTTGGLNVSTTVAFNNNTLLQRDSVDHIIAQRNGLNPQAFRIYNTYTTGTPVSSEFGYAQWSGNTFQIGTSATGGGQNRDIAFQTVGTTRMTITSAGSVGIGTSNPNSTLTVAGNISATGTVYASGGIVNSFYVGPIAQNLSLSTPISAINGVYVEPLSGYMGVQTFNPTAPLDVRGNSVVIGLTAVGRTPTCLGFKEQYLYALCEGDNTLNVYDTSTNLPQFVASATTLPLKAGIGGSYNNASFNIQGNFAYVATASGVQSFDISGLVPVSANYLPTTSFFTSNYVVPTAPIAIKGRYAYAWYGVGSPYNSSTLHCIDISDPYKLQAVPNWSPITFSSTGVLTLVNHGNYLYSTYSGFGGAGIHRHNVAANPALPTRTLLTSSLTIGTPYGAAIVQGRYLYLNGSASGYISVIDLVTVTRVASLNFGSVSGGQREIAVQGDNVYVLRNEGIYIFNASNPSNPSLINFIPFTLTAGTYCSFVVRGRFGYLSTGSNNNIYKIDLGGAYIQQLRTGNVQAENIYVDKTLYAGSDINAVGSGAFGAGLNVQGAANVQGNLSITPQAGTQTVYSNYFSVLSSNPTTTATVFTVTNNNRVGVNTSVPNERLTVVGNISSTQTIYASAVQLSSVIFTNETTTSSASVTATDVYVKVIVGGQIKYLRLFDVT